MAQAGSETVLRELADREAIRDLPRRYAHHVWHKDIAAIVDLFAEDATMDTPDLPTIRGTQALLEGFEEMLADDDFHPFVHNHVIDLDGDVAGGTCYLDLRATVNGRNLLSSGFYDDRYVRVAGEWKFQSRKVTMYDFVSLREAPKVP
ncbi:MAG: nuclear transport factor 2 family protein [Acidimicrobiia bacterium]|nr:nuclear transport factor 2 family protein [Acidimicrobiia bacterium]